MLRLTSFIIALLTISLAKPLYAENFKDGDFVSICYHGVSQDDLGDYYGVQVKNLTEQFDYLKKYYNVVSWDEVVKASQGKIKLPPKAVLITVDDGLASFYETFFPIIKKYRFPVVFAVVGKWIEDGPNPSYLNPLKVVSWKQLKELTDSGLVTVASHTYDLHKSHVFNVQGNEAASAAYFKYKLPQKKYESDSEFLKRLTEDLRTNNQLIKKHTGLTPSIIVWPYGEQNGLSMQAAKSVGLKSQFTIRGGVNNVSNIETIHRGMILASTKINEFADGLETGFRSNRSVRSVYVNTDSFWGSGIVEAERNLDLLIEQALSVRPNFALIEATSINHDVYFYSSSEKMKGDFFSHVAHPLFSKSRISRVYAILPVEFLQNSINYQQAIADLARYTDVQGVFFREAIDLKTQDQLLERTIAAAKKIRPLWIFGYKGDKVPNSIDLYDYVMLSYPFDPQLDLTKINQYKEKIILSFKATDKEKLIKDVTQAAAQGFKNFHYDVSLNLSNPNLDLKKSFTYFGRTNLDLEKEAIK